MQPISTRHILVDGRRIAFGTIGEGEPVVLVHGTPATSLLWRNVAPIIGDAGFEVRFFDLLGYGESERLWDEAVDTSASGQVPLLIGLLNAWGIEKTHVVGHDIGGAIAQRMGVFHRDRLRSLTMINAVCFDASPSERTKQQMAPGLDKMLKASDSEH